MSVKEVSLAIFLLFAVRHAMYATRSGYVPQRVARHASSRRTPAFHSFMYVSTFATTSLCVADRPKASTNWPVGSIR